MRRSLPILLTLLAAIPLARGQDFLETTPPPFRRFDLALDGRLRQLTLEDVDVEPGKEIVVAERRGTYPDWTVHLSVWGVRGKKGGPSLVREGGLPNDAVFYAFLPTTDAEASLLLLRTDRLELFRPAESGWSREESNSLPFESVFPYAQPGQIVPIVLAREDATTFLVPVRGGAKRVRWVDGKLSWGGEVAVKVRAFHHSAVNNQALELPYWVRGSTWVPSPVRGSLSGSPGDTWFFPWMDEVEIVPDDGKTARTVQFRQLTEEERDDSQSYVVSSPADFDGDGRTDFLVNKFQGTATNLRADTTLFLTEKSGAIPARGLRLKPEGNRAAGALPVDFNHDGKIDLAVASASFNVWTIVRALVKRTVNVSFAFYLHHADGYRLDRPDFTRDVSFRFDFQDMSIEGFLPTLEGDFNGDGYPDALYARDRTEISVLVQEPGKNDPFPTGKSIRYEVSVPRHVRVGDLDGDEKSDVVLYEQRSEANRRVIVLLKR